MLYFKSLEAEGAFSFGKIQLPLANLGLSLITGRNLDDFEGSISGGASGSSANGAGKSSLLEILTHNIFATTGKKVRKAGVVNNFYPRGYSSRLALNISGTDYEYLQTRDHLDYGSTNQLWKSVDGELKDLKIKGMEETQKTFQQAVKLSLDDWYSTVYLVQQTPHIFTRTDSNDLKKDLLARIFNLNYKMYLEESKNRLEKTKTALTSLKSSIASTKSQIQAQLAALPYSTEEGFQTRIAELSASFTALKSEIESKNTSIVEYQQSKINRATKANYEAQIQDQLSQISFWNGSVPTVDEIGVHISSTQDVLKNISEQIQSITNYLAVLRQRDAAYEEYQKIFGTPEFENLSKLVELQQAISDLRSRISTLRSAYSDAFFTNLQNLKSFDYTRIPVLKELTDSLHLEVSNLRDIQRDAEVHYKAAKENWLKVQTGVCYACERPYPEDKVEAFKVELESKESTFKAASQKFQEAQEKLTKALAEYGTLQQKFNELENYKARLLDPSHIDWTPETLKSEISGLDAQLATQSAFEAAVSRCKIIENTWKNYESVQGDLYVYEKSLKDFQNSNQGYTHLLMALTSIRALVQQYHAITIVEVEELDEMLVGAQIRKLTTDRDSVGNDWSILSRDFEYFKDFSNQLAVILKNEEEIDILERKEQIYNSLIYSFGPKGLIVSRLDIICKYLTEKANFYISRILKEDVKLQFLMDDASLDLNITFKGKERGVANLSGGENGKIGLACMLGLRSLLPAEYQTNLLILDEPEANWDDRVRHELVNMLESLLASTNIDSIFMISHSTSVQDLQVWDTRLHCVKENGISSLEIRTR